MIEKARGIVLSTVRYKDNRMIVVLFTRQQGKLSFATTIGSSHKSRSRSILFQPLNVLEFETDPKTRPGALPFIKEPKNAAPYASIPFDPCKQSVAMFLQEFLLRILQVEEGVPNEPLYLYIESALAYFDALERDYANFHLVFLMRLTRFLGLSPNLDGYTPTSYFDLLSGCYTLERPLKHPYFLSIADTQAFHKIARMDFENMHRFRFTRQERWNVLSHINDYYRLHLPGFPQLSSLEILRELFD